VDIVTYGPWALLALGGACILVSLYVYVQPALTKSPVPLLIFGVLLGGVAVHGIAFLDPYGKLLASVQQQPSDETYKRAFAAIATGNVPDRYADAIVDAALSSPTPELPRVLGEAATKAESPATRAKLEAASMQLEQQVNTAKIVEQALANQNRLTEDEVRKVEPSVRLHMLDTLQRGPNSGLSEAQIQNLRRETLERPR
jgi:hypothetical protein